MSVDFHGLRTRSLQNEHLRLDYLTEAGPRLVRLFRAGSDENLLADVFDFTVPTPWGNYAFLGGHRLWYAPEEMPRTYLPDLDGLQAEELPGGVRLFRPAPPQTGIAKVLEVYLSPERPALSLLHELRNDGALPVELAPWALTQLPLGGTAILPLAGGPVDPAGLLPNRNLVLWPYTSLADDRLRLTDAAILIRAEGRMPPVKVGYACSPGWIAYWRAGVLFVKRFHYLAGAGYPDFGSSAESYCGNRFIELESLGPLVRLEPGQTVRHEETWELYADWEQPFVSDTIRAVLEREIASGATSYA